MHRSALGLFACSAVVVLCVSCSSRRGGGDDDDTFTGDDDDDTSWNPECDQDEDGAAAPGQPCFGDDCNDGDPTIRPGADEGVIQLEIAPRCGYSPSVAVDSAGTVHVSCYDEQSDGVRYAHFAGDAWESQLVAQRDVGDYNAIATPDDVVAIAFRDSASGDLLLGSLDGGDWSTEVVDQGGCGGFVQMLADASGGLHLAYRCTDSVRYAHASSLGAAWRIEEIQYTNPNGSNRGWVDLEVSANGVVHVVFCSTGEEGVRYYSDATGAFALDAPWVPNMGGCGAVAIALRGEEPELAFQGTFDGQPDWRHATRDSGEWLVDYGHGISDYVMDPDGDVYGCGEYPGVCWDRDGELACPVTGDELSFYECSVALGPDGTLHVVGPVSFTDLVYVGVPFDGVDRDCDGGET